MQEDNRLVYADGMTAAAEKLTSWTKEPSLEDLKGDVERGVPFRNAHMAKMDKWADNLNITGSAKITPRKGRSSIQPRLIRKQAEWRYTALSEPFLNSGRLFTVTPRTWNDTKAAKQAQTLINWQMDTHLNKVGFIDQFVRTAVDDGTVAIQVGWITETEMQDVEIPQFSYTFVSDPAAAQQLFEMAQASPEEIAQLDPLIQESIRYSTEKGEPYQAAPAPPLIEQQEVTIKNYPTLEVAEIRNLVIDPTCGSDASKARFIAYSMEMSRAEMDSDGRFKNLDAINWSGITILNAPDHETRGPQDFNFPDKARNTKVVNFYWGVYDIQGDGKLQPIIVAWIDGVMVRCGLNPFPDKKAPMIIVPLLPIKKSFYGEPDGELLADNQKIIGAVTRGMVDLLARSANSQRGTAKNMLDAVNQRRFDSGDDYQFNPNVHPSNSLVEHKFPEIPASAMNMVGSLNMEAESLTGVKMFSGQGISGASLGPTAAGARGVLDAASRREMGILRRLAAGLAEAGSKIAAMNQAFLSKEEVIRVTDEEFVQVDQESLKGNYDLKLDIATADEDEARASRLEFMLQTMGPQASEDMVKLILSEIATLRRMPELAHKIENFKPEPDPMQQKIQEMEIAEKQSIIDLNNAKRDSELAQAMFYQARAGQASSDTDNKNLDYVEQETGTKHARRMDEIGAQARANTESKITEAILNQSNGKDKDGKVDTSPRRQDIVDAVDYNNK